MEDFKKQGGVSFLLVNFTGEGEFYLLPFETLKKYWEEAAKGGESPYHILRLIKSMKSL